MSKYIRNNQRQNSRDPSNAAGITIFGEQMVAHLDPQIQLDFQYGTDRELTQTFVDTTPGTGSVTEESSMVVCSTGGGVGGYGVIRTKRFLQYKPGMGASARFTCVFSDPQALSIQWGGFGSLENKLSIGYNGTQFGCNRRTGGLAEVRTLTVTSGTGSGAADLTLNGVVFNPVLTAGTVQERAQEIAEGGTGGVSYTGWRAEAIGDTVVFQAESVGAKGGAYSLATVGAGTFAETRGGAADGDNWVYQSDFSVDKLDGTGPSGMIINPQKGNVYQISYQWLGFGQIDYSVENPETGQFQIFHVIKYGNAFTTPSLLSPSMQVELVAASLGTSETVTIKSASMGAFIQGMANHHGKPHSANGELTTSSSTAVPIFSVKAANIFNGKINFAEYHPALISIASSSSGNKPGVIEVWRDATLTGPLWTYVEEGDSHVIVDNTATALSGGDLIMSFDLASTGQETIDLHGLDMVLNKENTITIAARSVSGSIDFASSLTWEEDY